MMKILIIISVLTVLFSTAVMAREDPMKGPWQAGDAEHASQGGPQETLNPGPALVRFYRTYISPIDGSHCGMYPSCSEYSIEAFKKHGFFMGWIMTTDRLYRCGRDELKRSPWIRVDGELKCYDPVSNNDFWWHEGR
jgi:putative membrane protein insertion efficiency factor